jgi:predicted nucleic-acid-binding Zn-ribbon protein
MIDNLLQQNYEKIQHIPKNKTEYLDIQEKNYYIPSCDENGYTNWYKNTLIPIIDNKLIQDCKIYHMPNNYVGSHEFFGTIKFDEAIKLNS